MCAKALGLQASSLSHLFDTLFLKAGEKTVEWIVENRCIMQCRDNDEDAKCTRIGFNKEIECGIRRPVKRKHDAGCKRHILHICILVVYFESSVTYFQT